MSFADLLYPHANFVRAGGSYRCTCLHTYEPVNYIAKQGSSEPSNCPDPEQEEIIAARHAQHLEEILLAAGAELPKPDPRQRLRERAAAQQRRDPQILRDGSMIVPGRQ